MVRESLKRKLQQKNGNHIRQPSSLVDLEHVDQEDWAKVTPERIQMLLGGYPERLEEVRVDRQSIRNVIKGDRNLCTDMISITPP